MELAIFMDESWHSMAGATGFLAATVLSWLGMPAIGELFISLMRVTRRVKPCSRAVLLRGDGVPGLGVFAGAHEAVACALVGDGIIFLACGLHGAVVAGMVAPMRASLPA